MEAPLNEFARYVLESMEREVTAMASSDNIPLVKLLIPPSLRIDKSRIAYSQYIISMRRCQRPITHEPSHIQQSMCVCVFILRVRSSSCYRLADCPRALNLSREWTGYPIWSHSINIFFFIRFFFLLCWKTNCPLFALTGNQSEIYMFIHIENSGFYCHSPRFAIS